MFIQISSYKKVTSACRRECGEQQANHSHVFRSCGIIKEFWEKAIEEQELIFKVKIENDPLNMLLGKTPENMTVKDSHLFLIVRLASVKQITKNWQKPYSLTDTKCYILLQ